MTPQHNWAKPSPIKLHKIDLIDLQRSRGLLRIQLRIHGPSGNQINKKYNMHILERQPFPTSGSDTHLS